MASATPCSPVIVDLSCIPQSSPSICIPRVFSNITWMRVKSVFEELGLGEVERVDMVKKENEKGESFKKVFVHFKHWASTTEANQCRQKLISGDQVKIIYDTPWFWKISASKVERPEHNTTQKQTQPKSEQRTGQRPRVDLKGKGASRPKPHQVKATRQTQSKQAEKSGNVSALRKQLDAQQREIEELKRLVGAVTGTTTSTTKPKSKPVHTKKHSATASSHVRTRPTIRFDDSADTQQTSGQWGQPTSGQWGGSGGVTPTYSYEPASPVAMGQDDNTLPYQYQPTSPVWKPESPKEVPESLKIEIPKDE
jgi:hypothetical protein